jgi:hypothetical protein
MNLYKDENRPETMPSLVDADKQRRSLKEKWPRYSRLPASRSTRNVRDQRAEQPAPIPVLNHRDLPVRQGN